MTGRGSGKNYLHKPYLHPMSLQYFAYRYSCDNPSVTIGLSVSVSPTHYRPADKGPLYVVLTARILSSPEPSRPVTLATWDNPFQRLGNCSYSDIACISGPSKAIKIESVSHWPKYGPRELNVREFWDFITLCPNQPLEVCHEVPRDKVDAAYLETGEVYKASLKDLGLGTSWWMYGKLDDAEGKKFMRWSSRGVEGEKRYRLDNADKLGEPLEDEMWEDSSEWIMGEEPSQLALVIEKGEAEFEVV